MAYNFPNSPNNGDTVVVNGSTYTYVSATNTWKTTASSGGGGGASVTSSDTAPTSPSDGDLWWNSAEAIMYVYYDDGSSSQWVSTSTPGPRGESGLNVTTSNTAPSSPTAGQFWWNTDVNRLYIYYTDADSSQWVQATTPGADGADGADGSSVTSYANYAAFPTSGDSVGDFAFATDTKAVYIWDGSEWDRISAGVDESPVIITEPPTTEQALNSDGTTSTVTMTAQDPEGFDITYGIAYKTAGNVRPSQLAADTTIDQSNGVFTFTPTSNNSLAGTFTARLSASDGARTTTRLVNFGLSFTKRGLVGNGVARTDPLASNLLLAYPLSDAANGDDYSGNANHLQQAGTNAPVEYSVTGTDAYGDGPVYTTSFGKSQTSLNYAWRLPSSTFNFKQVQDLTFECWAQLNSPDTFIPLLAFYSNQSEGTLSLSTNNNARANMYNGFDVQGGTVVAGRWHHFAYVRDTSGATDTHTIYLDGIQVATTASNSYGAGYSWNQIGSYQWGGSSGAVGYGAANSFIQDMRIYNTVKYTANFNVEDPNYLPILES